MKNTIFDLINDKWRPISMAPENTLVLLYEPHGDDNGGFIFVGIKNYKTWRNNLDLKKQMPTHWMPLPAYPVSIPNA